MRRIAGEKVDRNEVVIEKTLVEVLRGGRVTCCAVTISDQPVFYPGYRRYGCPIRAGGVLVVWTLGPIARSSTRGTCSWVSIGSMAKGCR